MKEAYKKFLQYILRNLDYELNDLANHNFMYLENQYNKLYLVDGKYLGNSPHQRKGLKDNELEDFWDYICNLPSQDNKDASFYENLVKENT